MDTNFNNDNLNRLYLENIENYVILNEEMYKTILSNYGSKRNYTIDIL